MLAARRCHSLASRGLHRLSPDSENNLTGASKASKQYFASDAWWNAAGVLLFSGRSWSGHTRPARCLLRSATAGITREDSLFRLDSSLFTIHRLRRGKTSQPHAQFSLPSENLQSYNSGAPEGGSNLCSEHSL